MSIKSTTGVLATICILLVGIACQNPQATPIPNKDATSTPTLAPTVAVEPSALPTPVSEPTPNPSKVPTVSPTTPLPQTATPTMIPAPTPTLAPTPTPTPEPTPITMHTLELFTEPSCGPNLVDVSPPGLTLQPSESCSLCPWGTLEYPEGTLVSAAPLPAAGYLFEGWAGECSGTGACVLSMDKSKSATAVFKLSAGLTVSIEAADEPVEGTEWVVRVNITDVVDLAGDQFEVLYDPATLTIVSIEPGVLGQVRWPVAQWAFVPPDLPVGVPTPTPVPPAHPTPTSRAPSPSPPAASTTTPPQTPADQGRVRVLQHVSPLSAVSGSGYLAELHFRVNGMAGKVGNISIQNGKLFNSLGRQIAPVNWGCATVTIG